MPNNKYNVGDSVSHTIFGEKTTGVISEVAPLPRINDPYIYQIDGLYGSWWIAESDLTLVQSRPPRTHQIKTIDDILNLASALWTIDDDTIVSYETNSHTITICTASKDQSQASFRKELIATIVLQIHRNVWVFVEISEPDKPKTFYQYTRSQVNHEEGY